MVDPIVGKAAAHHEGAGERRKHHGAGGQQHQQPGEGRARDGAPAVGPPPPSPQPRVDRGRRRPLITSCVSDPAIPIMDALVAAWTVRRIGLHDEILGRARHTVLVRTVIDHRMHAGEVIERRRRRNRSIRAWSHSTDSTGAFAPFFMLQNRLIRKMICAAAVK